MKTYNGGSISNLLKNLHGNQIYVTDTAERAIRYANAQATGTVDANLRQKLAEGAVILEVECQPHWLRRPESHNSLDHCEDVVTEFTITKATVRFCEYPNTLYGTRHTGYKSAQQVVEILQAQGIKVEVQK